MTSQTVYVTKSGRARLEEELAHLREVKRPEIIERLREAKSGGDWMDSAEHLLVEEELAFVEARIRDLETTLATARIIEPDPDPARVNIGDTVVVQLADGEPETYTIVGVAEANPAEGLISNESPLGRALLDHAVDDEVVVKAPAGELRYRILSVD